MIIALAMMVGHRHASAAAPGGSPVRGPLAVDGASNRLAASPARFPFQYLVSGSTRTTTWSVRNYSGDEVRVDLTVAPLAPSRDPAALVQPAGSEVLPRLQAATSWIRVGASPALQLPAFTRVDIPITISIPRAARPGVYPLGLVAARRLDAEIPGSEGAGATVDLSAQPTSQLIVVVPGDLKASASISDVTADRIIWHRGSDPTFAVEIENTGDSILQLDAALELSSFGRNAARRLDTDGAPALPDGQRRLELRWSNPPLVGWFRPTLTVVGGTGSGVRLERELPTVIVIPPWWFGVATLLAVALPTGVVLRRRRRRRARP